MNVQCRSLGGMVCALALAWAASAAAPTARVWHSQSGAEVEAQLVQVAGTTVILRQADGTLVRIQVSQLSAEDQAYVRNPSGTAPAGGLVPAAAAARGAASEAGTNKVDPSIPLEAGKTSPGIACRKDSQWSYHLYTPRTYVAGTRRPVVFIMSPNGGENPTTLDRYIKGADFNGMFVALSVQSKNGFKDSEKAIQAMWDDVRERLPVDHGRCYATGFSGGGRQAMALAGRMGKKMAGVLPCGAADSSPLPSDSTPVYGICGNRCFNRWDMAVTILRRKKTNNRLVFFNGLHAWAPSEHIADGLTWLNAAWLREYRPKNPALAAECNDLAARVLLAATEESKTHPERAYERVETIRTLPADNEAPRTAGALFEQWRREPKVAHYLEAKAAMEKFVDKHFKTDIMDYVHRNGTKAAAQDAEDLLKTYGDTILADLIRGMGQESAKP